MEKSSKIYVAGHAGLVGSAMLKQLKGKGYHNIILREMSQLNLRDQPAVGEFFQAKNRNMCFWRRPWWAASTPTTPIRPISSTTTC